MTARWVDIDIDVSGFVGVSEGARIKATVVLPSAHQLPHRPIVCFAFPGATYARRYFLLDLPNAPRGGQAMWHAQRGWIFVAIDHLGVGESSLHDPAQLVLNTVAAANHAAVAAVLQRLQSGTIAAGFPAIHEPVVLGLGQSMGGCLTVVQQARHASFDGIAVLGFSAVHTHPPRRTGERRVRMPFIPRDVPPAGSEQMRTPSAAVNTALLAFAADANRKPSTWHYHFDDEPADIVRQDLEWGERVPPWRSSTMPGLVQWVTAPGVIAPEAASIIVPVLAAFGERDVLEDPRGEAQAYRSAVDFSMFICPRMAHMHNFATTREILWTRIASWGEHVAHLKNLVKNWPVDLYSDTY